MAICYHPPNKFKLIHNINENVGYDKNDFFLLESMSDRIIDHLWQKPYGAPGCYVYSHGIIFCPFMHAARGDDADYLQYRDDIEGLRQYHLGKGYIYKTSVATIKRYIDYFMAYRAGKEIYIPRRSLSRSEPSDMGIHVRATGVPYHGCVNGFYGLLCPVQVVSDKVPIIPGVRNSLQPNKYSH